MQLGQEAREYAQKLGSALVEAGLGLVVYFSDDQSLETHVVRGFVAAFPIGESGPCIDVRFSEAQRGQVMFPEQNTRPELFYVNPFPGQNWEAPFYRSLAERDSVQAVVLMAGGTSTLNAGQVAVGRGLPLLAIDKYSGSAQTLRTELATKYSGYPSSQSSSPSQLVNWLRQQQSDDAERHRRELKLSREYARMSSRKRGIVWFSFALIALLTTLGIGLTGVDKPDQFVVVIGVALVSAGATGALVRGLTTTSEKLNPSLASLLGMAAGLVVGLAYLIPQLIGAPQLLEPNASVVSATDKIQFLSVALVAFTAGIGFDVIFRRMQKEAEAVAVSVTR
ncbi:hypothetical protein [Synechococcus sp. BA-132 BA5]|uniref:hypothetical protein n=1 Tax=Synechococcus sp. BA-132 BA5 TaxID=3110252 RepID=UPI002B1E926F|nr:hypothetical protein [Synechococcus sp. BA-132 BA5]MEA5414231.1 hypothetical protein [Synechococcus sp. BA-132 BA5]